MNSRSSRASPPRNRFPRDLNTVVRNALDVFAGRLDAIDLRVDLAPDLPLVNADPEQFKRLVVNLVDNAAEAMRDSLLKRLLVSTRAAADAVELLVADTGCGISRRRQGEALSCRIFPPRGAAPDSAWRSSATFWRSISGRIRVEDNKPTGARFYVEIPAASPDAAAPDAAAIDAAAVEIEARA